MMLLGAEEVQSLLGVKKSKAYSLIQRLNAELESKGYITIRGKIPKKYLLDRFYQG